MINLLKNRFIEHVLWMSFLFCMLVLIPGFAQQEAATVSKSRAYMDLTFSQSQEAYSLMASVTARVEGMRGRQKVQNAAVKFYVVSDTAELLLGSATTDDNGTAILMMDRGMQSHGITLGELTFIAGFEGNEAYNPAEKKIDVGTVNMTMSFEEIDSVKSIIVRAYEIGPDGEGVPLEETVNFYVPRSFSLLKLGEGELEEGVCSIDFPLTLPGDTIGNLEIIARVEESDDYGNVEARAVKDWGMARSLVVIEKRRGLGDTDAPLWMVYTLIILLSAVWLHYLYVLFVFFQIKRAGRRQ